MIPGDSGTGRLDLPPNRKAAPQYTLVKVDPTLPHGHGRAGSSPHLRDMVPVAWSEQPSYHPDTYLGL